MSVTNTGTSLFRNALLIESAANIFGGAAMLLIPHKILSWMTHTTTPITPLSTNLVQWLGGLVIALATPLVMSYPNTALGIASRYTTYWTLGAGEVCIIAVMAVQSMSGRCAFTSTAVMGSIAVLGPTLAWRVFCLVYKPEWIGSLQDGRKSL